MGASHLWLEVLPGNTCLACLLERFVDQLGSTESLAGALVKAIEVQQQTLTWATANLADERVKKV